MTYTTTDNNYQFFVVGGNADGTESGRIYYYRVYNDVEYLFDYGTSTERWDTWTVSYWTSNTQLVLAASSYTLSTSQCGKVGITDSAQMHTLGFDGSKLFTGVKIL